MIAAVAAVWLASATPAPSRPPPSPEASALADRVARTTLLGAVRYRIGEEQAREVIALHPEIDDATRTRAENAADAALAELDRTSAASAAATVAQLFSEDEMRAILAFFGTHAGQGFQAVVLGETTGVTDVSSVKALRSLVTRRMCDVAKVCPPDR